MNAQAVTITVDGSPMPCYLARPDGDEPRPAVIVLQEIFGVNTEVKRITDLVASAGYVGLAINYYHRTHPDLNEPYNEQGLQNGFAAAGAVTKAGLRSDVQAAMAWLNAQDYVHNNRIATWGFCFGGTVAFVTSTLSGLCGAICFYGGHIAQPLPDGEAAPIDEAAQIQTPVAPRVRRKGRLHSGGSDRENPASAYGGRETVRDSGVSRPRPCVLPRFIGRAREQQRRCRCVDLVQSFLAEHFK